MVNQAIAFVVDTLFHLFILAALVRFWMQALRAPVRNPIAQFTMALTDFVGEAAAPRDPGALRARPRLARGGVGRRSSCCR